ncbi:MAG: altronate dehydratase family protein, partial [Muribaculaceae bacterium]|nr:altronate dehydratase family protein [Muribaculaceae bacterium]
MKRFIRINSKDNVAVALADDVRAGERFSDGSVDVEIRADIPRGHKFALADIAAGENVVKYGFPIGHATAPVAAGEWVHTHNVATSLDGKLDYKYNPTHPKLTPCADVPMVRGYLRRNGTMGIRNELWILPTVGCVNGSARAIAEALMRECHAENVDDIIAFTHNYGCSQLGQDHVNTRRALAAMARHPNAGGVIVLGLGCENNRIDRLREEIGEYDPERVCFITSQDVEDEIGAGILAGREILERMKGDRRTPLPASMLRVGLKCGGSDGLSGITANPLVGMLSDRIISWGGTTVLTEVPEMFGAETLLMNRAADEAVFDAEVKLINDFKDYFSSSGQPIYENPSPGNKAGGITTLEEKSLGCVQKGGCAEVAGVLDYADPVVVPGLNLLNAPGNDLVASTALALAGCQMVLFTTGRGTPFGTCVPTLKISTNSALAAHKSRWIDFDAGTLVG